MNSLALTARLVRDPEIRTRGRNKVCVMRVVELNGGRSPLYISVASFGREAETCMQYLGIGSQIAVVGRLRLSKWPGHDGTERSDYSLAAERVDFLPVAASSPGSDPPLVKATRGRPAAASSASAEPTPAREPGEGEFPPPSEALEQAQLAGHLPDCPACRTKAPARRGPAGRLFRRLLAPQEPSSRS